MPSKKFLGDTVFRFAPDSAMQNRSYIISHADVNYPHKSNAEVAIDILIDKNGNVVNAAPSPMKSTTLDPILVSRGRQAACRTKFNKLPAGISELHGCLYVRFFAR